MNVDITLVEDYLGSEILNDDEFNNAKKYAQHKLNLIIEREGNSDGERLKPYYLAQLIAETISSTRFSMQCTTKCQMNRLLKMGKEHVALADAPFNNTFIIAY